MTLAKEIEAARERIRGIVRRTPVDESPLLSNATSASVFLKLEQLQHTGSFKLRGAAAKLTALERDVRSRGVITASTGNHGLAVTYAARALGAAPPTVYMPKTADRAKVERLSKLGAEIVALGATCTEAELAARAAADESGRPYVSPYNDPDVVAGQGTLGLELAEDMPSLETVYVAVGGGGLIAGVAAALKSRQPNVRVIGCLPEHSQAMAASVRAGAIVETPELPTLSDATAGGVEPGSITFPLCASLVDAWVTVSEAEIIAAARQLFTSDRWVVEGAAAVAVAGMLRTAKAGERALVVLCGRNVSREQIDVMLGR